MFTFKRKFRPVKLTASFADLLAREDEARARVKCPQGRPPARPPFRVRLARAVNMLF